MSAAGYITAVTGYGYGSYAAVLASAGATSVTVQDASDFNAAGGSVVIAGTTYTYTAANFQTDVLSGLSPVLAADAAEGTTVAVAPLVREKRAMVQTAEVDETIDVRVPAELYDTLPEGIRVGDTQETCEVELSEQYEWVLNEVTGGFNQVDPDDATGTATTPSTDGGPVTDGGRIDPPTMPLPPTTDGLAPTLAPSGVAVQSGIQSLFVTWDAILNADAVQYEVYISTTNPPTIDAAHLTATVGGTLAVISATGTGLALSYGTTYYLLVRAVDDDGAGPSSAVVSGTISQITTTQISDDAISTPKLAANSVTAGEIAANAVTAAKLEGVMILGSRVVAGTSAGARAEMNADDGLLAVNGSGITTFQADTGGTVSVTGVAKSTNYVEGSAGWYLADTAVQFPSANVINVIGADGVTANAMEVAGQDVGGALVMGERTAYQVGDSGGNSSAIGSTETVVFVSADMELKTAHSYLCLVRGHLTSSTAADTFDVRLRYTTTTDGSTPSDPTTSSSIQSRFTNRTGSVGTGNMDFHSWTQFHQDIGSGTYNAKIAITLQRASGSSTAVAYNAGTERGPSIMMIDLGVVDAASTGTIGGTSTYTKKYYATNGASYYGDSTQYQTGAALWQGQLDQVYGNMRSLALFNNTQMTSDLSGATIVSVTLTFRVTWSASAYGLETNIKQHNNSTLPSTYAGSGTQIATTGAVYAGSSKTVSLGTTFGNALRDGTQKGIGFGPASPNDQSHYGYIYGSGGGSSAPYLTIKYIK